MNIVFTGKLEETRSELEESIEGFGHHFQKTVTYDTDMLIVGVRAEHWGKDYGKASKKEIDAKSKGIKILHVNSLNMILEYFV